MIARHLLRRLMPLHGERRPDPAPAVWADVSFGIDVSGEVPPKVPPKVPRSVRDVLCGAFIAGRSLRGVLCGTSFAGRSLQGALRGERPPRLDSILRSILPHRMTQDWARTVGGRSSEWLACRDCVEER